MCSCLANDTSLNTVICSGQYSTQFYMSTIVFHMRYSQSQSSWQMSCAHAAMPLLWKAFTLFCYAVQFTFFHYAMQFCTGMEPHSALPVAMPMVFSDHCDQLPKGLRGIKILAHTAVSPVPRSRMHQHLVILPDTCSTCPHTEHQIQLMHVMHHNNSLMHCARDAHADDVTCIPVCTCISFYIFKCLLISMDCLCTPHTHATAGAVHACNSPLLVVAGCAPH